VSNISKSGKVQELLGAWGLGQGFGDGSRSYWKGTALIFRLNGAPSCDNRLREGKKMHGQVDPVSIVVGGTAPVIGKHQNGVYRCNVWLRAG
jgi:hypothetical protein